MVPTAKAGRESVGGEGGGATREGIVGQDRKPRKGARVDAARNLRRGYRDPWRHRTTISSRPSARSENAASSREPRYA